VGQIARAEAEIDQALAQCSHHEELWCLPELLRVKGELSLLAGGPKALLVAERHFQKSLALALKQTSLSWELRTAMSFCRLRTQQCREKEAHELLAPTFARFAEGFGTPDVRSAKLLLDELNQGRPS
jgi:predicted ATPase